MKHGGTRLGAGRPEGSKNEKTIEWEHLGDFITEEGAQRAIGILKDGDDTQFMKYYGMFLEYFKPKQMRGKLPKKKN